MKRFYKCLILCISPLVIAAGCKKAPSMDGLALGYASYDVQTAFLEEEETVLNVDTRLTVESGGGLQGQLDYTLTVPTDAAELVKKYNEVHGTAYELLPEGSYSIGTGAWLPSSVNSKVPVTFYRSKVGELSYLLPVRLSADGVRIASGVTYIAAGKNFYTNPVIIQSSSDPTILRAEDGTFYLAATEEGGYPYPSETQGMPIFRSDDLVNWNFGETGEDWDNSRVFNPKTDSEWGEGPGGLWAPDLRYIGGKYVCYYSMIRGGWDSGGWKVMDIGVATSETPGGPYKNAHKLIDAEELGVVPSIDPFYYEEDGKHYMFWGTHPSGIWVTELTDDGLNVKRDISGNPTLKQQIAGTNVAEGVVIYKRGGWYYFFGSIGSPTAGAASTYHVIMGRSENLLGPYVTKDGGRLLDGRSDLFVESDDYFLAPGHNSVIIEDDRGQMWTAIHSYADSQWDHGHPLSIMQVFFDEDGWPYVPGNQVPRKALAPIFDR